MIYLRTEGLPEDTVECERLCRRAGQYTQVNDELYRRDANDTLMKCITPEEEQIILQGVHVGVCESHCDIPPLSKGGQS
jgi:hypothetical protein